MIEASRKKIRAKLLVGTDDQRIEHLLAAEEEMVLDRYPSTEVTQDSRCRVYRVPLSLNSFSSEAVSTLSCEEKSQFALIVSLEKHYPYQSPSISLEMFKPFPKEGEAYMQEEHLTALSGDIKEAIAPSVDLGIGTVLQVIQIVEEDLQNFCSNKEVGKDTRSLVPKRAVPVEPHPEKESQIRAKPASTPVPLKEKDGLKLSVFASHLLMKCCFLRHPESVEEAKTIFEQLHRYFLVESHLIPYKSHLYPWKNEQMKVLREEMESSRRHPSAPTELLKWVWQVSSGVSTMHASTGRYRQEFIERKRLGSGGFAAVFLCRKKLDGRISAIKKIVMHKNRTKVVLREVKMLANLNHKNVVRYIDCWVEKGYSKDLQGFVDALEEESSDRGDSDDDDEEENEEDEENEDDEENSYSSSDHQSKDNIKKSQHKGNYQTLYIQMELCSSITLRTLLIGDGRGHSVFRTSEGIRIASSIFRQLLAVIADTHDRFIVHRDLKPENILFNASETDPLSITDTTIRVVDFGLAKEMKRSASIVEDGSLLVSQWGDIQVKTNYDSECFGTVFYAAPELSCSSESESSESTEKVDEFSIGMIALEMWLAISGVDMRETSNIMNEIWTNRNAELPSWFQEKNPAITKVIRSLVKHNPNERKTCQEVLQHHSFPGDPPEVAEALQTIDRFGTNIVGAVMQHISQLECQMQGITDKEKLFYARMWSPPWLQLVSVSEMVSRIHGYTAVPLLKTHLPMAKNTKDYVVNSNGRSYLYSPFPHYAIANLLFSLPQTENIPSIFSLYCKYKPYLTFTTPFFTCDTPLELCAEPFCCFFHLLSCTRGSGVVRIVVSHTRWLDITSSSTSMYESVGGRSTVGDSPHLRCKSFDRFSGTPHISFPAREEEDSESMISPLPGNTSYNFPTFRKAGSLTGSMCGESSPRSYYKVEKNCKFYELIKVMDSNMKEDFGITLKDEDYLKEVKEFVTALQIATDIFEKYLPSFKIEIALAPFLEPSKDMIDRGIILSEGVFTVCEVECEDESSNMKRAVPNKATARAGHSGSRKLVPIAFGCTIDSTILQVFQPSLSSKSEGGDFIASATAEPQVWNGMRKHAFVFSIDGFKFADTFSFSPISVRSSFAVIDGVGLRASVKNTKQIIGIAAALWLSNYRACLAYKEDERTNLFSPRNIRYVLNSEISLFLANTRRPVFLHKQAISETNARNFFVSRLLDELGEEKEKKRAHNSHNNRNNNNKISPVESNASEEDKKEEDVDQVEKNNFRDKKGKKRGQRCQRQDE